MPRARSPKTTTDAKRRPQPNDARLMVGLLREFYNIVSDTGLAFGVSPALQQQAMKLAGADQSRPRPSETVLRENDGMARLLDTWRRREGYMQPDGTPKVLAIRGKGATLASLAKEFVPHLRVGEVVTSLCTYSEVARLKGDKVALIGHPVMITERTDAATLAWVITELRRAAETAVFNAKLPPAAKGVGRFQRRIYGSLPKKDFEVWSRAIRARLQETSDWVEAQMGAKAGTASTGKNKMCGVSLLIFRDDGNLG